MLDDLLRERLMDYANAGSEATRAPSPAQIRRRGRQHYARLAAGTLALVVLAAGGVAVGVGRLDRTGPEPPVATRPGPVTTPPAPPTTAGPDPTATTVAPGGAKPPAAMPATFVAAAHAPGRSGAMRLAVVSRATGKVVRYLEPASHQSIPSDLVVSADRTTVWFAYGGCVSERGVFRVAVRGGAITKVVADGAEELAVSHDGRKLAYISSGCGARGPHGDVVVRDLASGAERRWPTSSGGPVGQLSLQQPLAWSPDGRYLAVVVGDADQRQQVRLVDTTRAGSLAGAPLVRVPDRGCWFTNAAYQPGSGRLAVVEECHLPATGGGQVPSRSRLLFFDPSSRRLLARSLVLSVAGRPEVFGMSFDPSGRYLLYWAGQIVGGDSEPHPLTLVSDGRRVWRVPGRFTVPAW
jgi:hypothetical protein